MEISIEIYTGMDEYLPKGKENGKPFFHTLSGDVTVGSVKKSLNIPMEYPCGILVNGKHIPDESQLKEMDKVSIFPYLAGGCKNKLSNNI